MGLDMNLYGRKSLWGSAAGEGQKVRTEDGKPVGELLLDLGYWRKHPNLHGYIVNTFAGGVDECQKIHLDEAALGLIAATVRDKKLPHTEGFFFGSSEWWDGQEEEVAQVFDRAREWLEYDAPESEGEFYREVYYQASW